MNDYRHCVISPKKGDEKPQTGIVLQYMSCMESIVALCRLADGSVKAYPPVRLKVYQTEDEAKAEAREQTIASQLQEQ